MRVHQVLPLLLIVSFGILTSCREPSEPIPTQPSSTLPEMSKAREECLGIARDYLDRVRLANPEDSGTASQDLAASWNIEHFAKVVYGNEWQSYSADEQETCLAALRSGIGRLLTTEIVRTRLAPFEEPKYDADRQDNDTMWVAATTSESSQELVLLIRYEDGEWHFVDMGYAEQMLTNLIRARRAQFGKSLLEFSEALPDDLVIAAESFLADDGQ